MSTALELLTAILVLVSCTQDGDDLLIGRERRRTKKLENANVSEPVQTAVQTGIARAMLVKCTQTVWLS